MRLSKQAMGALMMALQKSLMEQSDIIPVLENFNFLINSDDPDELIVENPPVISFDNVTIEETPSLNGD